MCSVHKIRSAAETAGNELRHNAQQPSHASRRVPNDMGLPILQSMSHLKHIVLFVSKATLLAKQLKYEGRSDIVYSL
jgi:hypothetical protein